MARRDEADRQKGAFKQGQKEKALEVARNALRKNIEHAEISELTGLSIEDVKRLAIDLKD